MCGSATATIDESIAPMRVPNVMDTVTSHLFGFGRGMRSALTAEAPERDEVALTMGPGDCALPLCSALGVAQPNRAHGPESGHGSVGGGSWSRPPTRAAPVARSTTTSANPTHIATPAVIA